MDCCVFSYRWYKMIRGWLNIHFWMKWKNVIGKNKHMLLLAFLEILQSLWRRPLENLYYFHWSSVISKMCSLNRWTIRSLTSWLLIGFHWSFALTMTYPKVWMVFLLFHQLTWKEQACSLKVKWQNNRLRINLGNCLDGDNNVLWNMAFMLCYLSRPNGNT